MTADKQCGFGSTRVYFGVVLTRGVVGVVVLTDVEQFPGETPEGARLLVERLPAAQGKAFWALSEEATHCVHRPWAWLLPQTLGDDHRRLRVGLPRAWVQALGRSELQEGSPCSTSRPGRRSAPRDCGFLVAPP